MREVDMVLLSCIQTVEEHYKTIVDVQRESR